MERGRPGWLDVLLLEKFRLIWTGVNAHQWIS